MNVLTNAWNIFAISHFAWPANFFSHAGVSLHWSELFRAKMTNWNNTQSVADGCPNCPIALGNSMGWKKKKMHDFKTYNSLSVWGLTMSSWQQKSKTKHWVALWSDLDRSKRTTGDVYSHLYICNCIHLYLCLLLVCLNLYNCVSARIAALKWSGPIKIDDWR